MNATQTAVRLLTAQILVSVPVKLEPQGGAVIPAFLGTPGEQAELGAQVSTGLSSSHWGGGSGTTLCSLHLNPRIRHFTWIGKCPKHQLTGDMRVKELHDLLCWNNFLLLEEREDILKQYGRLFLTF